MTANQRIDNAGNCIILLTWNPPPNAAEEDVSHYLVYVNETINFKEDLTLTVYPVGNCGSHNIRVAAVNRCDRVSQNSSVITLDQAPSPFQSRVSDTLTTQPPLLRESSNTNSKKLEGGSQDGGGGAYQTNTCSLRLRVIMEHTKTNHK